MFAAVLGYSISRYFVQCSKAPYKGNSTDKRAKSCASVLILLQTSCLILGVTLTLSFFIWTLRARTSQPLKFLPVLKLKATGVNIEAFLSSLTKKEIYIYIYIYIHFSFDVSATCGGEVPQFRPENVSYNNDSNLMFNIHHMLSVC